MAQIRIFPVRPQTRPDTEPTLEALLDDPVAQAMMRRDGVTPGDVRGLFAATRARRAARTPAPERCCA
jgi:hypothetical protein